uniref:Uncharacterized protein n=1 Tax=Arcella intermedia TaxID=1963864 RepID=A0A6B2L3T3_9EUKA
MQHAQSARVLVHSKVLPLMDAFLVHKRQHGTPVEKQLYQKMTREDFIFRLIEKRPIFFFSDVDSTRLRDGTEPSGSLWPRVGTEKEGRIKLTDYLSYDEMQISALIGISSEVMFINQGERKNKGNAKSGGFEKEGVYVGLVGCRFEKEGMMEYQHVLISDECNGEKGYGVGGVDGKEKDKLRIWGDFYEQRLKNGEVGLMDYKEAEGEYEGKTKKLRRYKTLSGDIYFNVEIFKKRLSITIETFLYEADLRAKEVKKMAYVHAVGLGMGAWQVTQDQEEWLLDVFAEAITQNPFDNISDINFSWWKENSCGGAKNGNKIRTASGREITIIFSKRNPAEKLSEKDRDKLLVCCYAWDSNSFPGNEYWCGLLDASGDPAAASCSTIPEMHNVYVNPCLSKEAILIIEPDKRLESSRKKKKQKKKKDLKGTVVVEKES